MSQKFTYLCKRCLLYFIGIKCKNILQSFILKYTSITTSIITQILPQHIYYTSHLNTHLTSLAKKTLPFLSRCSDLPRVELRKYKLVMETTAHFSSHLISLWTNRDIFRNDGFTMIMLKLFIISGIIPERLLSHLVPSHLSFF